MVRCIGEELVSLVRLDVSHHDGERKEKEEVQCKVEADQATRKVSLWVSKVKRPISRGIVSLLQRPVLYSTPLAHGTTTAVTEHLILAISSQPPYTYYILNSHCTVILYTSRRPIAFSVKLKVTMKTKKPLEEVLW